MLARLAFAGAAAVFIGLAIGGASLASSSSGSAPSSNHHRQTLRLVEFQRSFVPEDGHEANKPGTLAVYTSVLKTPAGHAAGRGDYKCTELTLAPAGVYHCDGTYTFTDSCTIEWAGLGTFAQLDFTVSVIGGTGRYLGASGQLFSHSLNATGTKTLDTFTLIR